MIERRKNVLIGCIADVLNNFQCVCNKSFADCFGIIRIDCLKRSCACIIGKEILNRCNKEIIKACKDIAVIAILICHERIDIGSAGALKVCVKRTGFRLEVINHKRASAKFVKELRGINISPIIHSVCYNASVISESCLNIVKVKTVVFSPSLNISGGIVGGRI